MSVVADTIIFNTFHGYILDGKWRRMLHSKPFSIISKERRRTTDVHEQDHDFYRIAQHPKGCQWNHSLS
jgi:hypothetical protein